jgi:hypothetical protein
MCESRSPMGEGAGRVCLTRCDSISPKRALALPVDAIARHCAALLDERIERCAHFPGHGLLLPELDSQAVDIIDMSADLRKRYGIVRAGPPASQIADAHAEREQEHLHQLRQVQ